MWIATQGHVADLCLDERGVRFESFGGTLGIDEHHRHSR
jgi:hypothetical protein